MSSADSSRIALGEDLNRFRNASRDNYDFLRSQIWSQKAERLGFGKKEVFVSFEVRSTTQISSYCWLELLDSATGVSRCNFMKPANLVKQMR